MPRANCGWMCRRAGRPSRASQPFHIANSGEQQELAFDVTPPAGDATASLRAMAVVGGRDIAAGVQTIDYPHFPPQTLFPPSDVKLVRADIEVKAHRVGYIMGAGDEMPDALRQLGLEVTLLSPRTWSRATSRASTPLWRGCAPTTCGPT